MLRYFVFQQVIIRTPINYLKNQQVIVEINIYVNTEFIIVNKFLGNLNLKLSMQELSYVYTIYALDLSA